ncbi:MAG: hypothetical protein AAF546_15160 [Verrucomicrobiota bacterium]
MRRPSAIDVRKSSSLLFVCYSLLTVTLCGYEQGSYFLFDLLSSSEQTPKSGRLALNDDLFNEENATSVLASDKRSLSEFEFDPQKNFSFSQNSTFMDPSAFVFLNPVVDEDLPVETFSFGLSQNEPTDATSENEN